jgi:hypothetical protein
MLAEKPESVLFNRNEIQGTHNKIKRTLFRSIFQGNKHSSVAKPVERQHLMEPEPKFFWVCKVIQNVTKTP